MNVHKKMLICVCVCGSLIVKHFIQTQTVYLIQVLDLGCMCTKWAQFLMDRYCNLSNNDNHEAIMTNFNVYFVSVSYPIRRLTDVILGRILYY